jgi:hypothetical protein
MADCAADDFRIILPAERASRGIQPEAPGGSFA